MKRLSYLDGWRGLAIIGVLVDHFFTSNGINLGRFGVELFFVLSGRLMGEVLFVKGAELKAFFLRRVARIYPALLVCMTLTFAVGIVMRKESIIQFLTTITLTYNYAQYWTGRWASIDHVWSLCIEEHMYILLGAIAFVARKYRLNSTAIILTLAGAFALNGIICTSLGYSYDQVYWRSDVRGASILMGAGVFLLFSGDFFKRVSNTEIFSTSTFIVALCLNINVIPDPIKYSLGTLMLAISIAALPYAKSATSILSWKPLAYVGTVSYSLYLYQQIFALVLYNGAKKLHVNAMVFAPIVILIVFIVALGSYYFIEKPARIWLNKVLRSGTTPIAPIN